ncbi:S41 family peptidase [Azotobacter armeniacus]
MRRLRVALGILLVVSSCARAEESPSAIFDQFWRVAKEKVYPHDLVGVHFTDAQYQRLHEQTSSMAHVYELTPLINRFLSALNVSHTQFYDDQTIDFYLFRSMFDTRDIAKPEVNHIGAQFIVDDGQYVVCEVLNGYPAERAGLRRGDRVLKANNADFHPYRSFNPEGHDVRLLVQRNEEVMTIVVSAVRENPNQSFERAISNSIRTYEKDGRRVGYVRLWSGTHKDILKTFHDGVTERLGKADAIVLDLRGGFGGAWYDYLDLFFANRKDYFSFSIINRKETLQHKAEPQINKWHFDGPMVVLVNEGTRSGKEALAYQFKKTGRALLLGTTTQGAFSLGEAIFNDRDKPYFLYLSSGELRLDGNKVEGVGISPDVRVEYDLNKSSPVDPQLEAAVQAAFARVPLPGRLNAIPVPPR